MLTGTGFGDDFGFTHPLRQQSLAEHLVSFMRAAVQQIFALEIQRGVSASRNVLAFGECGWTPGIVFQQVVELSLKFRIFCALTKASSSWRRAGIRICGTYMPPNSPKYGLSNVVIVPFLNMRAASGKPRPKDVRL